MWPKIIIIDIYVKSYLICSLATDLCWNLNWNILIRNHFWQDLVVFLQNWLCNVRHLRWLQRHLWAKRFHIKASIQPKNNGCKYQSITKLYTVILLFGQINWHIDSLYIKRSSYKIPKVSRVKKILTNLSDGTIIRIHFSLQNPIFQNLYFRIRSLTILFRSQEK